MILGEYGSVPGDIREPLADIQTSGKHLLRLINDVLDLAKIEAGRMELGLAQYSPSDIVESVRATGRRPPRHADRLMDGFLRNVWVGDTRRSRVVWQASKRRVSAKRACDNEIKEIPDHGSLP